MKKTIFVIDDAAQTLDYLQATLQERGYRVVCARNGAEALGLMQATRPDLIITDVLMPELDGFAFLKKLKEDNKFRHIPILVLTARAQMQDAFIAIGVDDFVIKPLDPQSFFDKVRTLAGASDPGGEELLGAALSQGVARRRILLAGRKKSILDAIAQYFGQKGFDIDMCFKGEEVSEKAAFWGPDAIIMDVLMFGLPSYEIVRKLKMQTDLIEANIIIYHSFSNNSVKPVDDHEAREMAMLTQECMAEGASHDIGLYEGDASLQKIEAFIA